MNVTHYIGLDVHKKSISFCIKTADGQITDEGQMAAERYALRKWASERPQPWRARWKRRCSAAGSTTR